MAKTEEQEQMERFDVKMRSLAHKYVAPEHHEKVLKHYAKSLHRAKKRGVDISDIPDEAHDRAFASIVRDNPHVARETPQPKTPQRRPY